MSTYRVLVVDDSALARAMLTEVLGKDPEVEVAYAAPNGALALDYLDKQTLDLVCLDVEMPKMNGIEVLRRIRGKWPSLPVLMCSSLTHRGAAETITALSEGASDYIPKPSAEYSKADFSQELRTKVRALVEAKVARSTPRRPAVTPLKPRSAPVSKPMPAPGTVQAVAIGCSTGGPGALATLFGQLYRPLSVPLFIVQHMPPLFTKLLAERLSAQSGQLVKEGEEGELVKPGICYLAPGGSHMTVGRRAGGVRIALNQDPPENFCRPAVDVLFRGLASTYGGNTLAAVLTGMGHDGSLGAQALVETGARVLVQDPGSCVVPSMPQGVVDAGAAHAQLSLEDIGRHFDQAGASAPARAAGDS